jgi:lysozyme
MVNNKDKPWHKRLLAKVTALAAAVCMMLLPATAHADMQGIDVSNWQCGIDIANTQADFVVVGTTWGTGQVNNNCLVSGVNTDANRMIAQAQASGKKFGLYHYAMGGNPEAEAQFFYRNTSNYWRHGIVALDWEMDDNPAWGNWDWVRRFMRECERLSGGVRPLLYTAPVASTIPSDIRAKYGLWIAQYANTSPTGYQASPWMIGVYGEAMRQYSSAGVVNTWSPIDLNIFRGEAWQWDLYSNPAGKTQTTSAHAATESEPVDEPSAEMVAAQAAYEKSSEKTDFSKKMDSVWEYLKKLFRLSLDTKFIATRRDAIILNIPILIPIVALFAWGATIWLMLIGLFFGMRYRIDSDGDVPGSINNLMNHAADAADDIKQNLNDDK